MLGGVITWLETADLFRPRVQLGPGLAVRRIFWGLTLVGAMTAVAGQGLLLLVQDFTAFRIDDLFPVYVVLAIYNPLNMLPGSVRLLDIARSGLMKRSLDPFMARLDVDALMERQLCVVRHGNVAG